LQKLTSLASGLLLLSLWSSGVAAQGEDWLYYGGDAGGTRYSTLTQINRENIGQLELAWSYRTGVAELPPEILNIAAFHATPLKLPARAGGHLVFCSPLNQVIALDPATGEERWRYDPEIDLSPFAGRFNCRGISQWQDPDAAPDAACAWRLFMGTNDRRLIALDARSGAPCVGFGQEGIADLNQMIVATPPESRLTAVQFVSPPAVYGDVVVLGSTNNAKFRDAHAPSGMMRAFDARTGKLRWTFDTLVRLPGGAHTPTADHVGGANVWSMLSVDTDRGLLFVPTASPSPDFYGALRPGDNRYANSVVALDIASGKVVWHQQLVHHDVWDYDLPAQPILADITRGGESVPVVIQLTKMGMVFTFHRATGEPFFPIEERPVPQGGLPDEQLSPTQPFPVKPPPLVKHGISPDDAWGFTFLDRSACRKVIENSDHGEIYTPPSTRGTVLVPAPSGGHNWGGGAYDSGRNLLITPVSQVGFVVRILPLDQVDPANDDHPMAGMPFGPPGSVNGTGYALQQRPFLSPMFSPCTAPPWAKLVAVDMTEGVIRWEVPLGVLDKLMPVPIPLKFGTPFSGGPIVTATGLVFIGATLDERVRAFDTETGEELWQIDTPTAANATPMTYMAAGRQFVVIAAGGHMFQYRDKISDYLLAFSLPTDR
jgi:quinoprotein glucose dehydrogenase